MNGIDCDGHGTHCSGTVGSSSYGVATGVNIWGVRVLNCQGSGTWSAVIAGKSVIIPYVLRYVKVNLYQNMGDPNNTYESSMYQS